MFNGAEKFNKSVSDWETGMSQALEICLVKLACLTNQLEIGIQAR